MLALMMQQLPAQLGCWCHLHWFHALLLLLLLVMALLLLLLLLLAHP
jgi:hypothetical protein